MRFIALSALMALVLLPVHGATLRLGTPVVSGNQYRFPVYLQGEADGVAALDFRLAYDPAVFSPVSAHSGTSAASAQKQVSSNVATPGEFVVVMMGFNQNSVAPGEVVQVVLEKIHEPVAGESVLRIAEPTMARVDGSEIDSRGLARTVNFGKPKDKESPEDEGGDDDETEEPGDGDSPSSPENTDDGAAIPRMPGGVPFLVAGQNRNGQGNPSPGAPRTADDGTAVSSGISPANGESPPAAGQLPGMAPRIGLPAQNLTNPGASSGAAPATDTSINGDSANPTMPGAGHRAENSTAPHEIQGAGAAESGSATPPSRPSGRIFLLLGLAPVALFVIYKVVVR